MIKNKSLYYLCVGATVLCLHSILFSQHMVINLLFEINCDYSISTDGNIYPLDKTVSVPN